MKKKIKLCLKSLFCSIKNMFFMTKRNFMSCFVMDEYKKNIVTSYKGCIIDDIESKNESRYGPPLMKKILCKYNNFNVLLKEF